MNDAFWELFTDTGDPICWLLSRANAHHCDKDHAAASGIGNGAFPKSDINSPVNCQ